MTDFMVGIFVAPMLVSQLVSESLTNDCMFNEARAYLTDLFVGASMSSVALISYDRYLHVTKTQNYGQVMSKRKVAALITVGWTVPAVLEMAEILGISTLRYAQIAISVYIYLCFLCVVVFYIYIMKFVRKKEKEMAHDQAQDQIQHSRISNEIRVAKVVAAIIACFFITLFPSATYLSVFVVESFLRNDTPSFKEILIRGYCHTVLLTLALANSGINPLIYYFRNPEFKKKLVKGAKRVCPLSC